MPKPNHTAPALLAVAVLLAVPCFAAADSAIEPAVLTAPADGAKIQVDSDQTQVTLGWKVAPVHERVRYFVEVVAINTNKLSEVFASYVDRPTVTVTLYGKTAEYAWRVYTVEENAPDYALSNWWRFDIESSR